MAAEQVPVRKTVVPPHHYPNWKAARGGPRVVEYTSDTDSRRNKRNERRKTLFRKSHELAVISAGHVFTMYIDDNGQAWIYTNSDALWQTYCTIGLKQGPLEKRCDENIKVIDVSDAHLEETKFYGAAAQPSEPTENTEHTLYPEIKTEPISSPDGGAVEVGGMAESSEENSPQPMQQRLDLPGSQFNYLLPQPTMKVNSDTYIKQEEQPTVEVEHIVTSRVHKRTPSAEPTPKEPSEPRAGQKRQIEPLAKYRIAGSSCVDCARGFPDKKRLRLHLSCHKNVGQGSRGQSSSSSKGDP